MANLPSNLPKILRDAGLKVVEVDGWRDRGRPGPFGPVGVLCHHTATRKSSSDAAVVRLLRVGRSDLPGPLSQVGLARDGTVYLIAAGRANHAGRAKSSGTVAAGDGNELYIGIEAFNSGTGEKWNKVQYDAYVLLCAVLCLKVTGNSVNTVRAHKETSVTGKIDPFGPTPYEGSFDMGKFRARVQAKMKALTSPAPAPAPKPATSHTRWTTKTTGVHDAPNGKKLRDLAAGDRFEVIDGSGAGKGGWVETTFHNWVNGYDTTTEEPKAVTSHTRWAVRVTGVHATKGGTKLRDLQPGESFKVIDGSGHGNDGWIETTHHNWVAGDDTTTTDPDAPKVFSVMTWNVENKGEADAALDRAEVIELLRIRKPHYFCGQEVYRVDLSDIPGYQTYQAWDGYSADSENRAQAILVRNDVDLKIKQALVMHEKWIGPKMGKEKDPRIHRYTVGNEYDTNIPVATVHVPFTKAAIEETRKAIVEWMLTMKAAHGIAIVVGDWNGLADELQAKVGDPAGAKVDGGGLDKAVFLGVKKVKGENLGKRGRSDHPVKVWTFEA